MVHQNRMPIRWGDQDAMGHVNNTVYFRYMEQNRIEWLESFGFGTSWTQTEGPVIVNASCTFLLPLTYPGNVEVMMFFGAPGRSSFLSSYEIRLQGDDTLYATGEAKIVWTDVASGRSVMIPEDLRQRLSTIGK